jgi:hypothetical protein
VRTLLLDKVHQYYRESNGHSIQQKQIEAWMIEVFSVVFKINDKSIGVMPQTIQFKCIDFLAFMAH